MLRDLLDALRCPSTTHDESWLVAMVHHATGPVLRDADLACPVCGAEFSVRHGEAHFAPADAVSWPREREIAPTDVMRVAALLNLTEEPLPVLLGGGYTLVGEALLQLMPANTQVWINAARAADTSLAHDARVSRLQVGDVVPLGVATLAAAALDADQATPSRLASVVRAVRLGGRIVAPADVPMPSGVKELARDAQEWVAEVATHASGLVELRRRAPDQVG